MTNIMRRYATVILCALGIAASACDSDGSMTYASACLCDLPAREMPPTAALPQACFWTHLGDGYNGTGNWRIEESEDLGVVVEREKNRATKKRKSQGNAVKSKKQKDGQISQKSEYNTRQTAQVTTAGAAIDDGTEVPCVDINTAPAEDLMRLPGIGKTRAQKIITARNQRPFRKPASIMRVKGIGKNAFKKMSSLICPF